MSQEVERAGKIAQLKRCRACCKSSITKNVNDITRLVSEGGSRSKIRVHRDALLKAYAKAEHYCKEIENLDLEEDCSWIISEKERVDVCIGEADEYLEARRGDAPSEISDTARWVNADARNPMLGRHYERQYENVADLSREMERLQVAADADGYSVPRQLLEENLQIDTPQQVVQPAANVIYEDMHHEQISGQQVVEVSVHESVLPARAEVTQELNGSMLGGRIENIHANMIQRESLANVSQTTHVNMPITSLHYGTAQNRDRITGNTTSIRFPRWQTNVSNNDLSANVIDAWIDALDENYEPAGRAGTIQADITISAMIAQQSLPRIEIPKFDGNADKWVEFISKFRDIVHKEAYLNGIRKCSMLYQNLTGDAKRSVAGLPVNHYGYVIALKRIKSLFGDKSKVANAVISRVTRGNVIRADSQKELSEYYYNLSDCIIALQQLNYLSDLSSTDVLAQAVRRLPKRLQFKWSERMSGLKSRGITPTLVEYEVWVREKVVAYREAANFIDVKPSDQPKRSRNEFNGMLNKKEMVCILCKGSHNLSKCADYKKLDHSERYQCVKKSKLCFTCLGRAHSAKDCMSKNSCFVEGCSKRHHTSLHRYDSKDKPQINVDNESKHGESSAFNGILNSGPSEMYLQVVPVTLRSPNGRSFSTYALLDSGSHVTLVRKDIAQKMQLKGSRRLLNIGTIKDNAKDMMVEEVTLTVQSRNGKCKLNVDSAFVVPKASFRVPSQPCPANYKDADIYTHLDGIDLKEVNRNQIAILIGANVPEALMVKEVRRGRQGQPLAVNTMFGWTLFGSSNLKGKQEVTVSLLHTPPDTLSPIVTKLWSKGKRNGPNVKEVACKSDSQLHEYVERFWSQENSAISGTNSIAMSVEDSQALKVLKKDTRLVKGRYQVPMLWKDPSINLPNNIELAKKRFKFLLRRLRADPALYAKYKEVIEKYVESGHARKMTKAEADIVRARTWYMPTHPVFNVNKPGKVRVVNDAAAMYNGTSLNNSLITGPDLLNSLIGVLMRFRVGTIAIVADIEAMFHQVLVDHEDADSLRFLWTDNINANDQEYVMQMLVHVFGAKDSLTCAIYALHKTAQDNKGKFSPLTLETVYKGFYVDDLLKSVNSIETAVKLVKELTEMLQLGGFRLTKWISNSNEVLNTIPESEVAAKATMNLDLEHIERALGIVWNVRTDCFTFKFKAKETETTKRGILKVTSSLFDPLGFVTPFVLKAKILLQELWRRNYDWDDDIKDDLLHYWKRWLESAKQISAIKLNRCYTLHDYNASKIQLHVFCDASEVAYGAVAYFRYCLEDESYHTAFVMAKSKLAPIRTLSLPRLELSAAVAGVRLYQQIIKEIDLTIHQIYFWSDSTLTLQYISNTTQRFKVFVANRVTEILEATSKDQWRHVPGDLNPADLASRGVMDPARLMTANQKGTSWFNGPAFMSLKEEEWPPPFVQNLAQDNPEIKTREILVTFGIFQSDDPAIDINRFSSWKKLHRVAGWILRFIANCKTETKETGQLSCEELDDAELVLVREVQRQAFKSEIETLRDKGNLHGRHVLSSLSPFIDDDNLMRVGGRLRHASIAERAKHPMILPKNHQLTKLIIDYEHKRNGHVGPEHVLSNLRQKYWIVHGRSIVKCVIRKCFFCQVKRAKFKYPYMADLPAGRIAYDEPPFTHCGVDLFGPLQIKQGRKRLKRWVVLFTCLTVRCVHLEVVENADTDAFINALRRFVNRRACPKVIYSDNGTNFKGASSELKEFINELDHGRIKNVSSSIKIKWKFNPPAAPHMGGAWERLVRSTKEVLSGLMESRVLTDDQLYTLLTEVESILNSRPITHLSNNPADLDPLTPNHILLGLHKNWHFVATCDENDTSSRRKWRQVQAISQLFWDRWRKEYMPELAKRNKWKEKLQERFKVGELVILVDDDKRKSTWSLGRIVEMFPGDDGIVRVITLRTKSGLYTRPITKIGKLEDNDLRQGGEYVTEHLP